MWNRGPSSQQAAAHLWLMDESGLSLRGSLVTNKSLSKRLLGGFPWLQLFKWSLSRALFCQPALCWSLHPPGEENTSLEVSSSSLAGVPPVPHPKQTPHPSRKQAVKPLLLIGALIRWEEVRQTTQLLLGRGECFPVCRELNPPLLASQSPALLERTSPLLGVSQQAQVRPPHSLGGHIGGHKVMTCSNSIFFPLPSESVSYPNSPVWSLTQ